MRIAKLSIAKMESEPGEADRKLLSDCQKTLENARAAKPRWEEFMSKKRERIMMMLTIRATTAKRLKVMMAKWPKMTMAKRFKMLRSCGRPSMDARVRAQDRRADRRSSAEVAAKREQSETA